MRGRPVDVVKTTDWSVPWEVRNRPDDEVALASFATQGAALAYCRIVGAKVGEVRDAAVARRAGHQGRPWRQSA